MAESLLKKISLKSDGYKRNGLRPIPP